MSTPARDAMLRAIMGLYLEVDGKIVDDVRQRFEAAWEEALAMPAKNKEELSAKESFHV